jgi:iron complex outermembrane recepter protein
VARPVTNIATAVSAALRALAVCAPVAVIAPAALAQSHQQRPLTVDIPAQPLVEALATFARQTGLQFVYVSSVVRNQKSHAISAGSGTDEALTQLLEGTGLRFEYLTPRSIRILPVEVIPPPPASAATELPQVVVTANRREENRQDVPITVQVLTGETLAALNARTFDDFLNYLPGITAHGVGPGQNNIYIRGLATGATGIQSSGVIGSFPNVSVYLDEQSAQLAHRNLDIYTADLERIEILEGPQGTLFGAGAEAGVVRYITNKPKLNVTETLVSAGYATTTHGAPSSNLDATINLPLIPDKLAVRGVIYDERRGGYINNTPATFARADSDLGLYYAYAGSVPANSVVIDNSNLVANDINSVSYKGLRVEALYQFDDDWSVLLAQSYQNMDVNGVFTEMAADSLGVPQPELTVQLFNPSFARDRFENTALTIEGRAGALKLLYAGSYLVRNVEQVQDYTSYARGVYVDYYQCVNPFPGNPSSAQCFSPSSTWRDAERNTHQSHELRLTTPGEWRLRGVGGLFYEDYRVQEQTDWFYVTALPYFNPIGPPTGYFTLNGSRVQPDGRPVNWNTPGAVLVPEPVTSINPSIRPLGDGFLNDLTRGYQQKAAYASFDLDIVPKTLTLTAGTRFFSTDSSQVGSVVGSVGCQLIFHPAAPNPCVNHSNFQNDNAAGLDRTFSGFRSRASLSWKISDDALLYYTWSQGYRAGGFNRGTPAVGGPLAPGGAPWQEQATAHGGVAVPVEFAPDNLINNELGWKTMWSDERIQWNGALYQEDWQQVQIGIFAPGLFGATTTTNGGDYRVRGVETSLVARVGSGVTLEGGAAWNHSELVKEAVFRWADGTVIDFSTLQTASGRRLSNPGGTLGSPLAGAPPFQGNLRVRYDFALGAYEAFAQIGAVHQAHSLASTDRITLDLQGNSIAYDLPAFTTFDGALGIGRDRWRLQLYALNLTDTRAQLYANYSQWFKAVTVSRPRTLGFTVTYRSE